MFASVTIIYIFVVQITNDMKKVELYELLTVAILEQMHSHLLDEFESAKGGKQYGKKFKISGEIEILKKAIKLKQAQITLIGNL